jgi:hypothetical protein
MGIGTTNFSTNRLYVDGNVGIGSTITIAGAIYQTSTLTSNIFLGQVGIGGTCYNSNLAVRGDSYFSGNIGIGTTNFLTNKLYVDGNTYINGTLGVSGTINGNISGNAATATSATTAATATNAANATSAYGLTGTPSIAVNTLTTTGNVGIGSTITIAGAILQANSSLFTSNVFLGQVGIGGTCYNSNLAVIGNSYFSGNIGIGTTNFLTNRLYVDGNTYINGTLGVSGTINGTASRATLADGLYGTPSITVNMLTVQGKALMQEQFTSAGSIFQGFVGTQASNVFLGQVGIGGTCYNSNLAVIGNSYFSGNIGIGTTNFLTNRLYVDGNVGIGSTVIIGGVILQASSAATTSNVFLGKVGIGGTCYNSNLAVIGDSYFIGKVGIGTSDPKASLHVTGEIIATSDITAFSDKRLKENIIKLNNVENVINSISGYSFNWNKKGQELLNKSFEEIEVGLIAQEVQAVIPSAISSINNNNEDENYLTLKYIKLIPYLVEGYKLLNDKCNKQQEQINEINKILQK